MPNDRAFATFCTHGGRVAAARAVFGGEDWIDLSTGIAPWAWPAGSILPGLEHLPEPTEIAAVEAAAASAFGAPDPACVVAVPGTDLAMRMLAALLPTRRPAVLQPGYAGHRASWPEALAVGDARAPDLSGCDLFVLASPANPDGRETDPATLMALSSRMTVVVDEAYADPAPGLCPVASDRLIVLRSFGKFYGLPGLRLGFVVAGPDLAWRLRAMLGDWPISSPAAAIGAAAYHDVDWRRAQQLRIEAMGMALDRLLAGAHLNVMGRAPLFRLLACDAATRLFEILACNAILTRPFSDRPDQLRLGLPRDQAALDRLGAALQEFRN